MYYRMKNWTMVSVQNVHVDYLLLGNVFTVMGMKLKIMHDPISR